MAKTNPFEFHPGQVRSGNQSRLPGRLAGKPSVTTIMVLIIVGGGCQMFFLGVDAVLMSWIIDFILFRS
jgi:hypothetical protein